MSDCKQPCGEKFKTLIGGQALIEGIMMQGPEKRAIVVRTKNGLVTKEEPVKKRKGILTLPLIRGVYNFGVSMSGGVRALMFSADQFAEDEGEEEQPGKFEQWFTKTFGSEKLEKAVVAFSVFIGIAMSIGLFILLPTLLSGVFDSFVHSSLLRAVIEGLLRIAIFLGYLIAVSKTKDMKRVFSYHGAEHKTIRCYEARLPLTVENVRPMTRLHPRCGTSFLFVVVILSIMLFALVSTIVPTENMLIRLLVRLALLPLVVSVSYEFNRLVGRHDNWLTRILTAPGMWLQNFTTNEPYDSMIEVAIEALTRVIPQQEGSDRW